VYTCGPPTPAVVFHSVEKRLMGVMESMCQTLSMNSVLQKIKIKFRGGAIASPCTCLRAPLYVPAQTP